MLISNSLIVLIALLHIYFLVLEMFLWTKPLGLKVFNQSFEQAQKSATLAANQGLYNGFLAAGLLWSLINQNQEFRYQLQCFFLGCVTLAGLYGGVTVNRRIFFIQGFPAMGTLLLLAFQ